jgi:hypothetical protein
MSILDTIKSALSSSGNVPSVPNNSSAQELPVKSGEDFIGEFEVMDLSDLKDKTFVVSISSGSRDKIKFLASAVRGPYTFAEMAEEVGMMWKNEQHHAKVVILEKDRTKSVKFLDENTTDYIEAHFTDIVTESMLDGVFDDIKEYTCRAGLIEDAEGVKKTEEKDASQQDPGSR